MRSALDGVPGVGKIDIKVGDPDFKVQYDSKTIKPEAIVEALKKKEPGAKLKT